LGESLNERKEILMKEFAGESISTVADDYLRAGASLRELGLSARRLLVFVLMIVLFMIAVRPITDPDFWWHLRTGQYIFETGTIPHQDIFSSLFFGKEWVTHEWLSEVLMYLVHRALGYSGLVVTFALLVMTALWITYRRCARRAGHPYVAGFALLLGALASSPTWGVRPQIFSLLFASIFIAVLDDYAREGRERRVLWLAPLMVLWVNMHAGFALGLALIALTIAGLVLNEWLVQETETRRPVWARVRRLCLFQLACVMAVALNPSGLRMYSYPFETLTSQAMMKHIHEWFSPDFHELMFLPTAMLIFAMLAVLALSKKRVKPGEVLMLAATGYAALRSGRNIPFFALVSVPLLAEHGWNWATSLRVGQWLTAPEKREAGASATLKLVLNVALLVLMPATLCVLHVRQVVDGRPADEAKNFPVAAVEFIRAHGVPQPIYNEYGWGGYLISNLYPDYRVYIDGRADVYGDAFIEEFLKTHDGESNWREPLDRSGVRTVIVSPNVALASLLRQDAGWNKVFEDQKSVIFVRQ
jgi:hypothetical protein